MENGNYKRVKEVINGKEIEVIYRKGTPGRTRDEVDALRAKGVEVGRSNFCQKLDPRSFEAAEGVVCHRDLAVQMRDGVTIYCDIYLPKNLTGPVPAIVSWNPYGKRQGESSDEWEIFGVPSQTVSQMCKFECADPAYWCHHGYAIANADPRGSGNSEGDVSTFGLQDAMDGYDFIEWLAVQSWCNGKVGLFGSSYPAMTQYRIAAEQPPHLTCIAPWEGTGDLYREAFCPGGIPSTKFFDMVIGGIACTTYAEDVAKMLDEHPLIDEYWESKIPRWEDITVPAYICSGWCHFHLRGSFEAYRRISSEKKWIRAHRDFEWPDAYLPVNIEDLKLFLDRYLKDIRNGWELTPPVRLDVMDAYDCDYIPNKPEKEFPIARTHYRKLYLDASSNSASFSPFERSSELVYDPNTEIVVFDHKFEEDTELSGYMKLRLYLECRGHNEMDLFFRIKKLDDDGEYIPILCGGEPYRGTWGYMRASHRELDPKWSSDFQPVPAHRSMQKLNQGEIVPVDIEIWPTSRMWHKGEQLRLEITGYWVVTEWFEDPRMGFDTDNGGGLHVIHTGGEYESFLQVPVIPPKYSTRSGYRYRG